MVIECYKGRKTMEQPEIAQKGSFKHTPDEDGQVWWCACGLSKNQPFCDGSHKDTGFTPVKYEADADKKVFFCGCKRSGRAPFCDGSHARLEE